jgi:hypothetical protein
MDTHSIPRVGIYSHNGRFTLEVKMSPWYVPAKMGTLFAPGAPAPSAMGKSSGNGRLPGNGVAEVR